MDLRPILAKHKEPILAELRLSDLPNKFMNLFIGLYIIIGIRRLLSALIGVSEGLL